MSKDRTGVDGIDDDGLALGERLIDIHEALIRVFIAIGRIEGKLDQHITECELREELRADRRGSLQRLH